MLSLLFISFATSWALAFVYLKTKGPIEESARLKTERAIKDVTDPFDKLSSSMVAVAPGDSLKVWTCLKDENVSGIVVETWTSKGFSGNIKFVVGFKPDGTVNKIGGFEMKETPGLGTKLAQPKFLKQFPGINIETFKLSVKKDGGEVDAISAATISSRAFCDGLQRAYTAMKNGGLQ